MSPHPLPTLTALEARVLGVLVEKERTVPDTYPLTLNALVSGCNQKNSRDPVIAAGEGGVRAALAALGRYTMVIESSGGRAMRYAQNARRVLAIPAESLALLATLILRGPQTAGELRVNSERLHRFADTSAVEAFLHELSDRPAGALVRELPRQPGARETRWTQLLGASFAEPSVAAGDAADDAGRGAGPASPQAAEAVGQAAAIAALTARVERLERELAAVRALLDEGRDDSSRGEGPGG